MSHPVLARPDTRYWSLRVPTAFTTIQPRFSLGEFMPLGKWFQNAAGITYYGRIVGLSLGWAQIDPNQNEWFYDLECPDYHPMALDFDTVRESELLLRLKAT